MLFFWNDWLGYYQSKVQSLTWMTTGVLPQNYTKIIESLHFLIPAMFCSTYWKWTLAGPTICPYSCRVTLFWETLEMSLPFRTWRHQALDQEVRAPRLLTLKIFFIEFGDLSIFERNWEARSTAIDTSISGEGYSIAC